MGKLIRIIIAVVLIIGFVCLIIFLNKNNKKPTSSNLNAPILNQAAKNPDGTMGPISSSKNYSSSLSQDKVGSLTFFVTDPSTSNWVTFPTSIPPAKAVLTPVQKSKQNLKSLIIQIKKVEVYFSYNGGHWETLNGIFPFSIDLLQLTNKDNIKLGTTKLAIGKYTEIRLYIQKADAVLGNGENLNLSTKDAGVVARVVHDFNINASKNTDLIIDFDGNKSINFVENKYQLMPFVTKLIIN